MLINQKKIFPFVKTEKKKIPTNHCQLPYPLCLHQNRDFQISVADLNNGFNVIKVYYNKMQINGTTLCYISTFENLRAVPSFLFFWGFFDHQKQNVMSFPNVAEKSLQPISSKLI